MHAHTNEHTNAMTQCTYYARISPKMFKKCLFWYAKDNYCRIGKWNNIRLFTYVPKLYFWLKSKHRTKPYLYYTILLFFILLFSTRLDKHVALKLCWKSRDNKYILNIWYCWCCFYSSGSVLRYVKVCVFPLSMKGYHKILNQIFILYLLGQHNWLQAISTYLASFKFLLIHYLLYMCKQNPYNQSTNVFISGGYFTYGFNNLGQ